MKLKNLLMMTLLAVGLLGVSNAAAAVDFNTNVALNKPAVASAGNAALANDGAFGVEVNLQTTGETGWWYVDLGAEHVLDRFALNFEGAHSVDFDVLVASELPQNPEDDSQWVLAYRAKGQTNAAPPVGVVSGAAAKEFSFDKWVFARYVKFSNKKCLNTAWGIKLREFQVFGVALETNASASVSEILIRPLAGNPFETQSVQLSAIVVSTNDLIIKELPLEWSVEAPANDAEVSSKGIFFAPNAGTYLVNCEAESVIGNISITVDPFDVNLNLALQKSAFGGIPGSSFTNRTIQNDGNRTNQENLGSNNNTQWYVDLGDNYLVNRVETWWGNAFSRVFDIQVALVLPADPTGDAGWTTVANVNIACADFITAPYTPNMKQGAPDNAAPQTPIALVSNFTDTPARFVKFKGITRGANDGGCGAYETYLREFEVYGTGFYKPEDNEAPEVIDAELISYNPYNATIAVEATDNEAVTFIRFVDAVNNIDVQLPALSGKVNYLISDLQGNTSYSFTITAIDLAENESEPWGEPIEFTTPLTPVINISAATLNFTEDSNTQTFTVSGINLENPITLTAPAGYTVEPSTLTPAGGAISLTTVKVTWINGLGNRIILSSSDWLEGQREVGLTYTVSPGGLSDLCSFQIASGGRPALVNVTLNEDKDELTYQIAPYYGVGTATWNANALMPFINGGAPPAPIQTFKINGADVPTASITRTLVNPSTISIKFNAPLSDGDVISYGVMATLVWTTSGYPSSADDNVNNYIDGWAKTYTVGAGHCDCAEPATEVYAGPPAIAGDGNEICWSYDDLNIVPQIERIEIHTNSVAIKEGGNPEDFTLHHAPEFDHVMDNVYCYVFNTEGSGGYLRATTADGVSVKIITIIDGVEYPSEIVEGVQMTPTGITAPSVAKKVVKSQFFTIDGRAVTTPKAGIYLVKKTFSDGSVKTEKALVK